MRKKRRNEKAPGKVLLPEDFLELLTGVNHRELVFLFFLGSFLLCWHECFLRERFSLAKQYSEP